MTRLPSLLLILAFGAFLGFVCANCFSNEPPTTVPREMAFD